MLAKVTLEGIANISSNDIVCICSKCGHHDVENAKIEFNFSEQKIFYLCSSCKHMNEMFLGEKKTQPLPKTRLGR